MQWAQLSELIFKFATLPPHYKGACFHVNVTLETSYLDVITCMTAAIAYFTVNTHKYTSTSVKYHENICAVVIHVITSRLDCVFFNVFFNARKCIINTEEKERH